MRALAHPLRLRMMELFVDAPRTTQEVAAILEQPSTRLYHHVAVLRRAGLLKVTETRRKRGTVETRYEAVSRSIGSTSLPVSSRGAGRATKRALIAAVLEQSRREVLNGIGRRHAPPMLMRVILSAPRQALPAVRRRLYKFVKKLTREYERAGATAAHGGDRWAITLTLAQVRGAVRVRRTPIGQEPRSRGRE